MEKTTEIGLTQETADLLREAFGAIGVTVEQGIEHLAPFYATQIFSTFLFFLFAFLLLAAGAGRAFWWGWRYEGDDYRDNVGEVVCMVSVSIFIIAGLILVVGIGFTVGDAFGALVSPEGYTISRILEALR